MGELDKARPLSETAADPFVSYLFYGPGGSGKTTLAMNHPGKAKVYLDIDERLHELRPSLTKEQVDSVKLHWMSHELLRGSGDIQEVWVDRTRKNPALGDILTEKPRGYDRIREVTNELIRLADKCKKENKPFPYDCVIADPLTRIADHLTYLILYRHNVSVITESLYDVFARNMKEWIMGFLSLPCDRIIIAHSRHIEKRHKETGAIIQSITKPLLVGQTAEQLVSFFTEAYFFLGREAGNNVYKVQTGKDRETDARTARGLEFEEPLKKLPNGQLDVSRIFRKS